MSTAKKAKVSVTLSVELLAEIDSFADRSGIRNRSNVMELWLRRAAQQQNAKQLERDTVEYYRGLNAAEVEEDADWAAGSSDEFEQLGIG